MTNNYRTNYSYSEEAFLLSSLQEVAKVWARGTGQASFHLNILDGMAQLELSFKLGGPGDLHCDPVHALVPPPPFPPYHEDQRPRRRKGPGRLERDRLRAEKHRAKVSKHERAEAAVSAVKLPFSGKILPVKSTKPPANRNLYPEDVPLAAAPAVGHRQAVPAKLSHLHQLVLSNLQLSQENHWQHQLRPLRGILMPVLPRNNFLLHPKDPLLLPFNRQQKRDMK